MTTHSERGPRGARAPSTTPHASVCAQTGRQTSDTLRVAARPQVPEKIAEIHGPIFVLRYRQQRARLGRSTRRAPARVARVYAPCRRAVARTGGQHLMGLRLVPCSRRAPLRCTSCSTGRCRAQVQWPARPGGVTQSSRRASGAKSTHARHLSCN